MTRRVVFQLIFTNVQQKYSHLIELLVVDIDYYFPFIILIHLDCQKTHPQLSVHVLDANLTVLRKGGLHWIRSVH